MLVVLKKRVFWVDLDIVITFIYLYNTVLYMTRELKVDRSGRRFTSISVDMDTYEKLCEIARKEERSISWIVKRITRDYGVQKGNA